MKGLFGIDMHIKKLLSGLTAQAAFCAFAGILFLMLPTVAHADVVIMPDGGLFDPDFYESEYPEVVDSFGSDPLTLYAHYVNFGKAKGMLPYSKDTSVSKLSAAPSLIPEPGYFKEMLNKSDGDDYISSANYSSTSGYAVPSTLPGLTDTVGTLPSSAGTSLTAGSLSATPAPTASPIPNTVKLGKGDIDLFVIGNSITAHGVCDYWFYEYGMSASTPEKDYVHILISALSQNNKKVGYGFVHFGCWEKAELPRSECLSRLDSSLSAKPDIIVIQVGENMYDLENIMGAYTELISYIRTKSPNSKIVMVDDFWSPERSAVRSAIAQVFGLPFADLSEIRGREEYQAGYGYSVYGDDGLSHVITLHGVSTHPNDEGMLYIASKVIGALSQ